MLRDVHYEYAGIMWCLIKRRFSLGAAYFSRYLVPSSRAETHELFMYDFYTSEANGQKGFYPAWVAM
jgi:hypothetical protein